MLVEKVNLNEADFIEVAPVIWSPLSGDERLAALVAYMTGDGTIVEKRKRYVKRDGSLSLYAPVKAGAFYSNVQHDLEAIKVDCVNLGMAIDASVTRKKTKPHLADGFQLQLGGADCETLVDAGTPVGKKVAQHFLVPDWIMTGSNGVKRAYIAALFGAEGTAPAKDKSAKTKMPRQPVLNMCKADGVCGAKYFDQLQSLLSDLGIRSSVTVTGASYKTFWLRIASTPENLIHFFEDVGYVYCQSKALSGWKWAKYLRAYITEAKRRRNTALDLRAAGESYEVIGKHIGLTRGAAFRLLKDIDAGRDTTAGHAFPHFDAWLADRWSEKLNVLKVAVVGRSYREKPAEVWNMLVSSPDHSYLLANGANNFNSFETMSGRVYYPFNRATHIQPVEFNPKLPIWVGMDFNIDPMSTVIYQPQLNGELWAVDEIVLFGSNTEEVCEELEKRFWRHQSQIVMYPDPAGGQRQHARGESDMDILREKGFKRIKYRKKHPMVADRVNAVNRMLKDANGNVRLKINPRCKHFINALEQTIYKKGTREVDKTNGTEHSADAGGYCIELEYPVRKVDIGGMSR